MLQPKTKMLPLPTFITNVSFRSIHMSSHLLEGPGLRLRREECARAGVVDFEAPGSLAEDVVAPAWASGGKVWNGMGDSWKYEAGSMLSRAANVGDVLAGRKHCTSRGAG